MAGRKSLSFLLKYLLIAVIRTRILFSLRLSYLLLFAMGTSIGPDLLYYALAESHLFNKVFIYIRNILIAILVLACSRLLAGIKTFVVRLVVHLQDQ